MLHGGRRRVATHVLHEGGGGVHRVLHEGRVRVHM